MDLASLLGVAGGFLLVLVGAAAVVGAGTRLASAFSVSPLLIGLTIVAFGTSAPELAIGARSALVGRPELGLAVVVGSNIFNVFGILGLCALMTPLGVSPKLVSRDVPLLLVASVAVFGLAADGVVDRLEGAALTLAVLVYTAVLVAQTMRDDAWAADFFAAFGKGKTPPRSRLIAYGIIVLSGLVLLVVGADQVVASSGALSRAFGVPALVVALTAVAVATSIPELVVSLAATRRREIDIAVGNVVGSNIFNLLAGLGITASLAPGGIPVPRLLLIRDLPMMILGALVCLPLMMRGARFGRWVGAGLLSCYAGYVFLVLRGLP